MSIHRSTVFAPAKLNLFLHLTGKRQDGYHTLDSLVCFADIGDMITFEEAERFSFHIDGPFANVFQSQRGYIDDNNLVVKAVRNMSQIADRALNIKITLTKNLPIASGLGGGSSDAASTLWGLQQFWNYRIDDTIIQHVMVRLGADVPVCYLCQPTVMRGIGDHLVSHPMMPEIPIVIVNPNISCSTRDVFLHHSGYYREVINVPERFSSAETLVDFLKQTHNDLYDPALCCVPDISNVLHALNAFDSCLFSRMSGSGASCFGLFATMDEALSAVQTLTSEYPDWHIFSGTLNAPQRY